MHAQPLLQDSFHHLSCQASDEMPVPCMQVHLLVKKFGSIRSLDCTCLVGPKTEQLRVIASLCQLQSLAIRGNYMTGNDAMRIVATLSGLTQLRFDDAKALMDDGLAVLSNLHCLAKLSLRGADGLHGGGLASLLSCTQLRVRHKHAWISSLQDCLISGCNSEEVILIIAVAHSTLLRY